MGNPESGVLRTLRIMVLALFLGAALWLAVATFLVMTGEPRHEPEGFANILLGFWAALVLGCLVVWPIVRSKQAALAAAALAEPSDNARLAAAQHYLASTIVGAALAEGTALFAAVGWFVTGQSAFFAASFLGLVALALLFPSQQKFERFVESGGGRHVPTSPS
jgi:hypothetical protein